MTTIASRSKLLSIVLLTGLALSACSGATPTAIATQAPTSPPAPTQAATESPTEAVEPVTLRFSCWEGDLGTYEDVMANLITPFTEETGIQVEYEVAPWGDYWTKFNTLAASQELPDIFCESVAYTADHATNGLIADLSGLQAELGDNYMWEATQNMGTRYPDVNGALYAVPFRTAAELIFYNKDIFDAAGVPYPTNEWTYDDLVQTAQQLTKDLDGDGIIDQYGFSLDGLYLTYDTFVKANGGQILDPEQTQCLATSEVAVKALEDQVSWIHDLGISPAPGSLDFQGAYPFGTGKFAMFADITPAFNLLTDAPFKWDVVLPPSGTEGRKIYGGPDPLAISAFSEHPEEAKQLLTYILSEKVQSDPKITGAGSIPFNKTVAYSDDFLNGRGYPANLSVLLDHFDELVDADFGSKWIEWRFGAMDPEVKSALLGEKTPEEALQAACAAVDEILASK